MPYVWVSGCLMMELVLTKTPCGIQNSVLSYRWFVAANFTHYPNSVTWFYIPVNLIVSVTCIWDITRCGTIMIYLNSLVFKDYIMSFFYKDSLVMLEGLVPLCCQSIRRHKLYVLQMEYKLPIIYQRNWYLIDLGMIDVCIAQWICEYLASMS